MSTEKQSDGSYRADVGSGSAGSVDVLIEELQERLRHTRQFLEKIRESDPDARRYVEDLADSLSSDLRRLRRKA